MKHDNRFFGPWPIRLLLLLMGIRGAPAYSGDFGMFHSPLSGVMRAHAVTASARGTESLYYNPAGLASKEHRQDNLLLLKIDSMIGPELNFSAKSFKYQIDKDDMDIEQSIKKAQELAALLRSQVDHDTYLQTTIELPSLTLYHFGFQPFAHMELSTQLDNDAGRVKLDATVKSGFITGFSVPFPYVSLGYSSYFVTQSSLHLAPPQQTFNQMVNAVTAKSFAANQYDFPSFSESKLGSAIGHNLGILFTPFLNNPSALGIAILNVGGTDFDFNLGKISPAYQAGSQKLDERLAIYGVKMQKPDRIPQLINMGLHLASPFNPYFQSEINMDVTDISGRTVKEKLGFSAAATLHTPDQLSSSNSAKGSPNNTGLLGFRMASGYRAHNMQSVLTGLMVNGHVQKLKGLLHLGVDYIWLIKTIQETPRKRHGFSLDLNFHMAF